MKIVLDTKTGSVRAGTKPFGDVKDEAVKNDVIASMRRFIHDNSEMSDYEEDSMWMSYRYCIGSHTIAAHMRAGDIAENCYGRMSDERSIFTAYDINREIEQKMLYGCGSTWYFPITSFNRIYTSAIDVFCRFVDEYGIRTKDDLLAYKEVHVMLCDNDAGYKIETVTWEEWLRPQVTRACRAHYGDDSISDDDAWKTFEQRNGLKDTALKEAFKVLTKVMPSREYFTMSCIDDLMVWNDLCHLLDKEHHHRSVLKDGTECEWYWTYIHDSEKREDGYYYRKEIGYRRVRVPVGARIGEVMTWIPDDAVEKDLY